MKKFYIFSAGCIRRGLELIHIQQYLQANGWTHTKRLNHADLIIIATCGVVRLNEINSLKAITNAAHRKARSADIIVTGCLPNINPDAINKIGNFIFVPPVKLHKLDTIINATIPLKDIDPPDSIMDNRDITNYLIARSFCRKFGFYKMLFYKFSMNSEFLKASVYANKFIGYTKHLVNRTRQKKIMPYFNINIADGCKNVCSFCATKFATGPLRSKQLDQIITEFLNGLRKGYKIFQLIGEDTGCYGLDIGTNLTALLKKMLKIEGDYQIIIIDCNPRWLVEQRDEIMPVLVDNQNKIKEIFVPLQSGSDHILEQMNRKYTAEQARSVLKELNERAPQIDLRTSLLVGFPGETEKNFDATKQLISGIDFAEVTVNRYEDRPHTRASKMPNKVDQEIIENRAQFLSEEMNCLILS